MSKPASIMFTITDLDVGGAEKSLVELATRLDPQHFSVSVVCLMPPGPLGEVLTQHGIAVESLGIRSVWNVPGAIIRWRRLLRRLRPQILQTFLFHANLLGRVVGIGRVSHVVAGIRVAERRSSLRLFTDRLSRQLVRCHVCVSEAVARFMHQRAGIPWDRLCVIPNGVDVAAVDRAVAVDRATLGISHDARVLLFLGRLDPQKGLDDLLRALELRRRRESADDGLRLIVVGDGPSRAEYEQLARDLEVAQFVRFAGWQPNPFDWLRAADGLVLPSRWEGMPNAVLEAMAARLPVIATAVEGAAELVVPGRTGWLVVPGSPEELAAAISEWAVDGERRRRFGSAGRERVERQFSYAQMVEQYERLYRRLLGS
jgi:starch synthase (maltosyl-transferring)